MDTLERFGRWWTFSALVSVETFQQKTESIWEFEKKNRPTWRHSTRSRIWTCREVQFYMYQYQNLPFWQCTSSVLKFFNCLRKLQTCSFSVVFLDKVGWFKNHWKKFLQFGCPRSIPQRKKKVWCCVRVVILHPTVYACSEPMCCSSAHWPPRKMLMALQERTVGHFLSQKAWYNKANSWNSWLIIPFLFFLFGTP